MLLYEFQNQATTWKISQLKTLTTITPKVIKLLNISFSSSTCIPLHSRLSQSAYPTLRPLHPCPFIIITPPHASNFVENILVFISVFVASLLCTFSAGAKVGLIRSAAPRRVLDRPIKWAPHRRRGDLIRKSWVLFSSDDLLAFLRREIFRIICQTSGDV